MSVEEKKRDGNEVGIEIEVTAVTSCARHARCWNTGGSPLIPLSFTPASAHPTLIAPFIYPMQIECVTGPSACRPFPGRGCLAYILFVEFPAKRQTRDGARRSITRAFGRFTCAQGEPLKRTTEKRNG